MRFYLEREQLQVPPMQGKRKPQPYHYLRRSGITDEKDKLRARDTMSMQEYLMCYIQMLRDGEAGYKGTLDQHLLHLEHITQDSISKPWHLIRKWSTKMFDDIEEGMATWDDTEYLRHERLRIVLGGSISENQNSRAAGGYRQQNKLKFQKGEPDLDDNFGLPEKTCNAWNNGRDKCNEQSSHPGNGVCYMHYCSYCYNHRKGGSYKHPFIECNRKFYDSRQNNPGVQFAQPQNKMHLNPESRNFIPSSQRPADDQQGFYQFVPYNSSKNA